MVTNRFHVTKQINDGARLKQSDLAEKQSIKNRKVLGELKKRDKYYSKMKESLTASQSWS